LACPTATNVKTGVITYKIAAHRPPTSPKDTGRALRDDALSRARFDFRWIDQFNLGLDPDTARLFHDEKLPKDAHKSRISARCAAPNSASMKITQGCAGLRRDAERSGGGGMSMAGTIEDGMAKMSEKLRRWADRCIWMRRR